MEWHTLKKEDVIEKLNSSLEGLSQKEAEIRLERYGKNIIEEVYKISPFKIFLKQFKSFLIYILLFAVAFSLAIKHFIDASVIFAIVLLNAGLGFVQQFKAEKSIINLRKMLKPEVKVFRNGRLKQISSEELVSGDLMRLQEGDKISADCRLLSIESLEVNEAILTGESAPVEKFLEPLKENTILAERNNMLFSGTSVVKGNCRAIVVETGMTTEFGKIAKMLQEITLPETPMQKKLDKFAKQVSLIVIFLAILTFIAGVSTGKETIEMFLTSIAIAVSVIPEGLPAIITINLALAVNIMSKKSVILRRLPAAETLGSVTVICVPGNTPIMCNPSIKSIDSVKIGDKVLGLDGNFHSVTKTFRRNYSGELIHIKPMGLPLMKITPEHPILIAKTKLHRPLLNLDGIRSRPREKEIIKPEWVPASEVEERDLVAIPRIKEEKSYKFEFQRGRKSKKVELLLDEELAELFGWYLAEGCCSIYKGSYHIIFYLGKKEKENVERVKYLIEKKLGLKSYVYQNRTSISIVAINKDLVNFLREGFGDKAINKKLPDFILSAPKSVITKFLRGYLKGDGNIDKYYIRFVTVSKTLAYQLIMLIAKLGIRCRLYQRKSGKGFIEGREVNINKSYELFINGSQAKSIYPVKNDLKEEKKNLSLFDEDFVYVPLRNIKKEYESLEVFNIETESNTYSLPFVVHNCSDKTGTITEEKMSVRELFCNNTFYTKQDNTLKQGKKKATIGKELSFLIKTSVLCNNARFELEEDSKTRYVTLGDPTETALVISALDLGFNKKMLTETNPRIQEFPFTSERKMMSILRKSERREILYVKGAPEAILKNCSSELLNGTTEKISDKQRLYLRRVSENLEEKGYRVLAFAIKFIKNKKEVKEEDLTFLGFMALLDPPRKEVREAILICKKAGIKVKIITGDSVLTAKTVAREVGITGKIVSGQELEKMTDEKLKKEIDEISIFARVSPQDKLRIVEILKLRGEEVAITGDGVNDVLALKKADIGIAMGKRGSDVAREVSDMILTDDNFASIIKGIEEGRVVYDNSKKSTKFLLASNFNEIFLIAYSVLRGFKLPLLPLQILWINLITDSFPALSLTKEKGEKVMETKPRKEPSLLTGIFWFVVVAGIISLAAELLIFHYGLANFTIEKTRTMVMFTIIAFEAFFVFECRSNKPLKDIGLLTNKWVIYAVLGVIILQVILIYTPLAPLFRIVPLSLKEWGIIILAASPALIVFEAWKLVKKKIAV